MIDQKELFLRQEGDAWFMRNQAHLDHDPLVDDAMIDVAYITRTLEGFRPSIHTILEVGCSSGRKLQSLCQHFSAVGFGIDPSALAVDTGRKRTAALGITLDVGTGDALPYCTGMFDLVYLAFCLYVVDRPRLMATLAEADRVVKPGGFLAITDFDPGRSYRKPYSHAAGAFSYKQDYSLPLIETGLYYLVGKLSFSHRRDYFDTEVDERVSLSLLYKGFFRDFSGRVAEA